ncbi:NAD(P)H-dependent glycerol-3-phosphate dehydrogenase [Chlamydia gallinacea]|uniref:Glycerol-3-phosphate dehydrogenase [NAD(P)+] n=2 Tax=Chlamydia gallinacea TaxID=1457153 RepID=A0A173DYJ6_9CHLA|nr:NAD(P)H-dependent glycerol-3-phosphate dehydrogenase [Chlamydia gallinacea]ANG65976.1 glycerol-3-phosphate dehydrogenase [Chlamydia gallinacea 08-1274/3]EYE60715.1 NAD-dependent glycerol-3-phosphate dehydrogenase family protein [Bacteroides fragilis str. S6L5]MBX6680113.1 NAD(P)-dependent glycerol-3-phosphate dehydrogenase [Chlamydia gallinacea]MBX6687345.1 NAD(P)-dependent glycerol-3-phosphate dehydrogenase [Chlamydia gallinacea]
MKEKIAYLGMGIWGFCLASLLANKGYRVTGWARNPQLIEHLQVQKHHPLAPDVPIHPNLTFTTNMAEALEDASMIVEGVSSAGIRPVSEQLKTLTNLEVPFVITSKGIEQHTGLLLSEIVLEIFGDSAKEYLGYLSGPSIASEVLKNCPCSVVISAYNPETLKKIHKAFLTPKFRVYPNSDLRGVALGGALKNIIAIACGISDGFQFGDNAKSGLVTRGLHEIRKFATIMDCRPDTLNGLAGLGDLCATCFSKLSRNTKFGKLIALGLTLEQAKKEIGMVVEGAYTALSAHQLANHHNIDMPITTGVYRVLYENLDIKEAIAALLQRSTKEEYL